MPSIENIQPVRPRERDFSEIRAPARQRFDMPTRILGRREKSERLPAASSTNRLERRFLRVLENREARTFEAAFGFELTGVVLNGRLPAYRERSSKTVGTMGDRLMSKLLPLLNSNATVRFAFAGGGEANFEWMLHGNIRNAESGEAAEAFALSLRRDLQMILGSEPCFRFAPLPFRKKQRVEHLGASWQTRIAPDGVTLRIPAQSTVGFADARTSCPADTTLRMPIPRFGLPCFRSVAEAVILNASPVSVEVTLNSYEQNAEAQSVVSDVTKWMESNPVGLRRQLSKLKLDPALGERLLGQLQVWTQNPSGVKAACRIYSPVELNDSFVQMVGEDVFGAHVSFTTQPGTDAEDLANRAANRELRASLDLVECLHPESSWPLLFPHFNAIANTRVKRIYNLDVPHFSRTGILLGHVSDQPAHPVRLTQPERALHQYVLGATGSGKSTLLLNMMMQDIRAGRGVGLIDPHGDLYDQLLEAVPRSRANDLFLFNPGSPELSPGINPLECHGPERSMQINFVINEMLKTFERLYDMTICGGPMFETYFRNAMLLLMESGLEEVTLTELSLVFEDAEYRKFLKARCKNPLVVGFWTNQAERVRGDTALENMAPYIASKINAFTCNAIIRPIVAQARSTMDFSRILNGSGIFLARLTKGALGELDTQLLGSFLLSKIFIAAMGRSRFKPEQRNVFHLYVDEFQNFTNDTVAHMLSEARKYGLYMTFANQNLSQLNSHLGVQNIADAVLGNVGNLIAFRIGPRDAERLHAYTLPEFDALDLQGLPNFHAVGRLVTGSGPTRPFVFNTLPAIKPRGYARVSASDLKARTQLCCKPVAEVETQILQRRTLHKTAKEVQLKCGSI